MILSFVLSNQTIETDIEELNLSTSQVENILFFGTGSGLADLDPHSVYDFGSYDVVGQVVEGLFQNDLSDPDLKVIPCLALDHGTWDGNIYTVELKQGIEFHDGTPFDAYAVKFSFDRLQYFIDNDMVPTIELYRYYDYQTNQLEPIIKNVNVVSDYLVEFEIGVPQGIFESLLCAVSSSILSPSSTPEFDIIDTYNGDLIGTGPFTFEYFDPDVEVSLRAFDNYWKGRADIDHLVVKFYYDPYERASALENNEIHLARAIPNDYIDIFETNPNFIVDTVESTSAFYVGMNNYWIDKDVREAISYAIDYNYLIDDLLEGRASRLRSPIPEGIFYSDDTLNVAETDLIYARTIMQGLGHGTGLELDDDDAWGASTFLSYNFTYLPGHYMSENTFYLVQSSLAKIGIEILDAASDWGTFLESLSESSGYHREMIQMYWLGWGADYNEPSNYINNLFTNRTIAANGVHYNGYLSAIEAGRDPLDLMDNVQLLMEEALMETDTLLREQYYLRIQQLLVEEDRPWVYGYTPLTSAVYSSEIQGFQWNHMSFHRFYGVTGVPYEEPEPEPPTILIVGTDRGLSELDPLNTWDLGPYDVIGQVAEGLFGYDYSDPNLPIIPKLAADYGTWDGNTYTVELKQGIEFHDGTVFDVDAVDFTFNRLRYFMDNDMAVAGELYEYYDPETDEMKPIINTWNFLDEYTVQFELNTPYALFETLLAYEDSFMLSPTSTPLTEYIDTYSGVLVGTGPFVYEYYDPDYEVSLRAFENYWNGEPSIDYLKFRIIYDENERANQLSNGEIHMIIEPPTDRRGEFEVNPEFSMDSIDSTTMYYLGMNNEWIDRDLREAISYAFDYDYLLNEIYGGEGNLLRSPIPNGIIYADDSLNAPTTDIIYARYLMQQMGYGVGLLLDDNTTWEASTFLSINHTYNIGNDVRTQLQNSLHESLGKIGIEVIDAGMSGGEFWNRIVEQEGLYREMLQLYWIGWRADYNDPSNYINNLFTNRTVIQTSNTFLYNGYNAALEAGRNPFILEDNVQLLMEAAIREMDSGQRELYYARIQELLVESDMPTIFGYVPLFEVWYNSEIQGFQVNSLAKLYFHGVSGVVIPDTEPPVTEIYLDGAMPWPWTGWFVSDVLVTLEASDDFSGVSQTGYSFDGDNWIEYTEPLLIEESMTIFYSSVDNAGNYEFPNSVDINIDKTQPTSEAFISGLIGMNGWYISDVLVTFEATDDLSGIYVITYSFDKGEWFPYTEALAIGESRTIFYISIDNAGNYGEVNVINVNIDKTLPTTQAILSGVKGMNGWYVSDVRVTLVATDDLSGVAGSGYSFDGVTSIPYTVPFLLDESKWFGYGSMDIAGNYDIPQNMTVMIDKMHPVTMCLITGTLGTGISYISDVLIELSAFDATSGVDRIEYSYDGVIWNVYIDPLSFVETGVYDIFYRSIDNAGNIEPFLTITIEIDKSPSAITDKIIDDLEDILVPPETQHDVDKATTDLQDAYEEFSEGEFYTGFNKIQNAIKVLTAAQENGAATQSVIDALVQMVQIMAENAINDAIEMVGEDNSFVIKSQDKYADALAKLEQGTYDDAIRLFKNAYKNAMKARITWVPESYLDDLNDVLYEIDVLKNSGISSDAISSLILAEEQILLAIADGLENNIIDSFTRHIIAISELENTLVYGVDSTYIIDMIMTSINDIVFLKIANAEVVLLGVPNDNLSDAWDFYYLGQEEWLFDNYETAILNYIQAIQKMNQALT